MLDSRRPHQLLIQALVLEVGDYDKDTSPACLGEWHRSPITELAKSMFHPGIGLGYHSTPISDCTGICKDGFAG